MRFIINIKIWNIDETAPLTAHGRSINKEILMRGYDGVGLRASGGHFFEKTRSAGIEWTKNFSYPSWGAT